MHTCIPSHGLKRSWHSYPRRVNAGNKNKPSMHHLRRRNVTTSMVGFKKKQQQQQQTVTYAKTSPNMVNPRDLAGERKRRRQTTRADDRDNGWNIGTGNIEGVLKPKTTTQKTEGTPRQAKSRRQSIEKTEGTPGQKYDRTEAIPVQMAVGWLLACLTSQQHASVSQGRICSDNFTCCHTEIEVADPTFYLTQSQYTDTGPTSPSADPITPGAWQGSHWSANF